MDFLKGIRWRAFLSFFIFLAGCAPEKPVITPSVVPSDWAITPALNAQVTAVNTLETTASPVVAKDCARGDYFDKLESGGQPRRDRAVCNSSTAKISISA